MVTKRSKTPLPTNWRGLPDAHRALLIADIYVRAGSRLRMKLLVFRTNRDMRRFYVRGLGRQDSLGRKCLGFVNNLSCTREFVPRAGQKPKASILEVDPRYFAVMCLVRSALCMEVITHEAVHAAYAYVNRSRVKWPDHDNPEERICYPAGRIAKHINIAIHDAGLYPASPG